MNFIKLNGFNTLYGSKIEEGPKSINFGMMSDDNVDNDESEDNKQKQGW